MACWLAHKYSYADYFIFCIVLLFYSILWWYRGSIAPIVDVLEEDLNGTASEVGLLSSTLYISYAAMQLPGGLLLQIYLPEFIAIISSFGLTITSFLFSLSTNIATASTIHLLSGLCIGPLWIAILSIIHQRFGTENIPLLSGVAICQSKLFIIVATTTQARIYEIYGVWRPLFWVISAASFLCFICTCFGVICEQNLSRNLHEKSEPSVRERELDTFDGDAHFDTALLKNNQVHNKKLCCCYFSLYRKEFRANNSVSFIIHTMCKSLKLSVLNYRNWFLGIWAFCTTSIFLSLNGLWFITYFMIKFGYSRSLATIISGLFYLVQAFSSLFFGRMAKKYKKRKIIIIVGVLCVAVGSIAIIYIPSKYFPSMYLLIFFNCIAGFGCGVYPALFALMREYNNYYQCSDTATSFIQSIGMISGFVVPLLIGELLDVNWMQRGGDDYDKNGDRHYTVEDYNFAFIIIPILVVIGIFISFLLTETNGENIDYSNKKSGGE